MSRDLVKGLLSYCSCWMLAVWLGGFTFYSAIVIPVLHDQLGSPLETGLVTQSVTHRLNAVGIVTIVLGLLTAVMESRPRKRRFSSSLSLSLLAVSAMSLIALFVLHAVLDRKLESGVHTGFYSLHRVYLWTSTFQWLFNSALLGIWTLRDQTDYGPRHDENPQVSSVPR